MMNRFGRNAFTLIELLVVIAIVALLASLIVPTVNGSINRAKSVRCLSNLKQIGAAVVMYGTENDGGLVLVTNRSSGGSGKLHWVQYLSKYVGNEEVGWTDPKDPSVVFWGCPVWQGRDASWNVPPKGAVVSSSPGYGMNSYPEQPKNWNSNSRSDGLNKPVYKLAQIQYPDKRVLVGDAIDWHFSATLNPDNGYYGFTSWGRGDPFRHGKSANYLFFDMHAAAIAGNKAHMYLYDPKQAGQ